MKAFLGQASVKATYCNRVQAHYDADEIIHGKYWERGKGCAVGCTIHSGRHAAYEIELGIPEILARLEDHLFESLTNHDAKMFPIQFLEAIPVGSDLTLVWPKFALWLLLDKEHGVVNCAKKFPQAQKAIRSVGKLFQQQIQGQKISETARAAWAARAEEAAWAARAAWTTEKHAVLLHQRDTLLQLLRTATYESR